MLALLVEDEPTMAGLLFRWCRGTTGTAAVMVDCAADVAVAIDAAGDVSQRQSPVATETRDHGAGLAPEFLPHAFARHARVIS